MNHTICRARMSPPSVERCQVVDRTLRGAYRLTSPHHKDGGVTRQHKMTGEHYINKEDIAIAMSDSPEKNWK